VKLGQSVGDSIYVLDGLKPGENWDLTLPHGEGFSLWCMARNGLLIGEVAARSGISRKALRLYEAAGILPAARRTASGYRVYTDDALSVVAFVRQAQRLGFTLDEIKNVVAMKRAGRAPCPHVHDLVRRKADELDRQLAELMTMRKELRGVLARWRASRRGSAVVCLHIERINGSNIRRKP